MLESAKGGARGAALTAESRGKVEKIATFSFAVGKKPCSSTVVYVSMTKAIQCHI